MAGDALQVEADIFRAEGVAVVELHAVAQVEDDRGVVGELPAFGERDVAALVVLGVVHDEVVVEGLEEVGVGAAGAGVGVERRGVEVHAAVPSRGDGGAAGGLRDDLLLFLLLGGGLVLLVLLGGGLGGGSRLLLLRVVVIVAAADQGQPGGAHARAGGGAQQGAAAQLVAAHSRPVVLARHFALLSPRSCTGRCFGAD